MIKTVFIAPHPDDESLGCGGTIHFMKNLGAEIHWIIVTSMKEEEGFSIEQIKTREKEIDEITKLYGFDSVTNLNFASSSLSSCNFNELIFCMKQALKKILPTEIFLPFLRYSFRP